jgi:dihydroneopterin aldolase
MSDRIYLHGMIFEGRHGVSDEERAEVQQIEVDVDVELDLTRPGTSDDLADTVDYRDLFDVCRRVVEERSFRLLEGIAEALAADVLERFPSIETVFVRAKKPALQLEGDVEHAGIQIERRRAAGGV